MSKAKKGEEKVDNSENAKLIEKTLKATTTPYGEEEN
jgi:hypothetical protein